MKFCSVLSVLEFGRTGPPTSPTPLSFVRVPIGIPLCMDGTLNDLLTNVTPAIANAQRRGQHALTLTVTQKLACMLHCAAGTCLMRCDKMWPGAF